MDALQSVLDRVRGRGLKVALPETTDIRILAGARRLKDQNLAEPILIGETEAVQALGQKEGVPVEGIEIVSPSDNARLAQYGRLIASRREKMSEAMAVRLARKPVYFAAAMLAVGEATAMIAGASMPTRRVIEAGMMTVGLAPGVATPSSFFVMVMKDGTTYIFADCALNIEPSADELADIAIASAVSGKSLLSDTPRIAMLSFSTKGSGAHPRVDKVCEAVRLAAEKAPDLVIDGELQADAALVESVALNKGATGAVAGRANVLIFPDLDSANISYKLVQRLAGAQAIGPFLQGFAKPICDLSRGATVDDVVMAAVIATASGGQS